MNPKYKLNDIIKFILDEKQYLGNVYIINDDGGFYNNWLAWDSGIYGIIRVWREYCFNYS